MLLQSQSHSALLINRRASHAGQRISFLITTARRKNGDGYWLLRSDLQMELRDREMRLTRASIQQS